MDGVPPLADIPQFLCHMAWTKDVVRYATSPGAQPNKISKLGKSLVERMKSLGAGDGGVLMASPPFLSTWLSTSLACKTEFPIPLHMPKFLHNLGVNNPGFC